MTITYNGHGFSKFAQVKIQLAFVSDETDANIIAHRLIINVRDLVSPDGSPCETNSTQMIAVWDKLSKSGKRLQLVDIGIGQNLDINNPDSSSSSWDIAGGPKVRSMPIELAGLNRVSYIDWTCEVDLPPGCLESYTGVMAFCYSYTAQINAKGYTTQTASGYIQIAQRHDENDFLTDTADNYREFISDKFNRRENCLREQNFEVSANRSRLNFSIVDREIESPHAYPAGVVNISAPIRSRFKWPRGETTQSQTTISVNLELQPDQPRVLAWKIFDAIVTERLQQFGVEGKTRIIKELEVSEDYFSGQYSFSLQVTATYALNDLLRCFGFFKKLDFRWADWFEKYEPLTGLRGASGFRQASESNPKRKMYNICSDEDPEAGNEGSIVDFEPDTILMLCSALPPPEQSWINANIVLIEAPSIESSVNTTYGKPEVTQVEYEDTPYAEYQGPLVRVDSSDYETCISESPPIQRWIWRGKVQRVGYPIPPLGKVLIGGKEAKIVGTPHYYSRLVGYSFCLPVYEAAWNIGLVVKETPDEDTYSQSETDPINNIKPEESAP